jgi:hypothetical protein
VKSSSADQILVQGYVVPLGVPPLPPRAREAWQATIGNHSEAIMPNIKVVLGKKLIMNS